MKGTEKYSQLKRNALNTIVEALSAEQREKLTMERNENVIKNENYLQNTADLILKGKGN